MALVMAAAATAVSKFSKPSACSISSEEKRQVYHLAEVGKHFVDSRAQHWVKKQHHNPFLNFYSSDGTPMRTMSFYDVILKSGKAYQRRGRSLHELLMERAYLKSLDSAGEHSVCCIIKEPRPLDGGQGLLELLPSLERLLPDIEGAGASGNCGECMCF